MYRWKQSQWHRLNLEKIQTCLTKIMSVLDSELKTYILSYFQENIIDCKVVFFFEVKIIFTKNCEYYSVVKNENN